MPVEVKALGLLFLVALVPGDAPWAAVPSGPARLRLWPRLPLSFEVNVGQASPDAQFVVHLGRAVALLSSRGVTTSVPQEGDRRALVRMELVGAAQVKAEALDELPGKSRKGTLRLIQNYNFPLHAGSVYHRLVSVIINAPI